MTAYVDDETKILLLPVPESKRQTKIIDTKYTLQTVGDLVNKKTSIEEQISKGDSSPDQKRFGDKTMEEIDDEMMKKRHQLMNRNIKIRKWQFLGFTMAGCFYMLIYRRFLHPKSIMNSVLYHNALNVATKNLTVRQKLGEEMTIMNCNGKIYPLLS